MSRSRRKNPITGTTTATSEKQEKRAYHRRYRHAVRQTLHTHGDAKPLPALREYSNPWMMGKDGKMFFDPRQQAYLFRK